MTLAHQYETSKVTIVKFFRRVKLRRALQRACDLRKDIFYDFNMVHRSLDDLTSFTKQYYLDRLYKPEVDKIILI